MLKIKSKNGFSLIELMLVVAVIGILAGIVMVPLRGQRERAEDIKILADLSATIQPILVCFSDGNNVYFPSASGTENICRDGTNNAELSAYGQWPDMDSEYQYDDSATFKGKVVGSEEDWSFWIAGNDYNICCNKRNKQCAKILSSITCDNEIDLTMYN